MIMFRIFSGLMNDIRRAWRWFLDGLDLVFYTVSDRPVVHVTTFDPVSLSGIRTARGRAYRNN